MKERELEAANTDISDLREKNTVLGNDRATLTDHVHDLEAEVDERNDVARQWKEYAEALEQQRTAIRQENERLREEVHELDERREELRYEEVGRDSFPSWHCLGPYKTPHKGR